MQGNGIEGVVLNRVCILTFFCPWERKSFKPSTAHLTYCTVPFSWPFFFLQQKSKYYNSKVEALVCFPCTHLVEMKRVMYETMFTVPWHCGLLGWPTGECSGNSPCAMYENSYMTPRFSGHFTSTIVGLVFFVLNSLLGIVKNGIVKNCNFASESSEF